MKQKNTILLLVLLCFTLTSFAQSGKKRKAVFAELGGAAFMGSVNYDFRFKPQDSGAGMRAGIGFVPDVLVFPLEINGVAGKRRLSFEYGVGTSAAFFYVKHPGNQTFNFGSERLGFIFHGKAGLRLKPVNRGFFFSFNWTPIMNTDEIRWLWFGIGLGYSWR